MQPLDDDLWGDPDGLDKPAAGLSALAQARKDIEDIAFAPLLLRHPLDERYALEFRTRIEPGERQQWQRRSTRPDSDALDEAKFNCLVLGATNTRILRDDEPLLTEDGNVAKFADREFLTAFGVSSVADGVRAFVPSDPHLSALAREVLEAAGFGANIEQVGPDPT